jgi:hypothetical protein
MLRDFEHRQAQVFEALVQTEVLNRDDLSRNQQQAGLANDAASGERAPTNGSKLKQSLHPALLNIPQRDMK